MIQVAERSSHGVDGASATCSDEKRNSVQLEQQNRIVRTLQTKRETKAESIRSATPMIHKRMFDVHSTCHVEMTLRDKREDTFKRYGLTNLLRNGNDTT